MQLYIDTTKDNKTIFVSIEDKGQVLAEMEKEAEFRQAEALIPLIRDLLESARVELGQLSLIKVKNEGGTFTNLRIGVAVANALGFALGIPVEGIAGEAKKLEDFSIVEPKYDREPNITKPKT